MSEYEKVDDEIIEALSISNAPSIGGIHIGSDGSETHFYRVEDAFTEKTKLFSIMQENIALRMTQRDGVEFVNMQTGKTLMRLSQDGDLYIKGIVKTLPEDDNVL